MEASQTQEVAGCRRSARTTAARTSHAPFSASEEAWHALLRHICQPMQSKRSARDGSLSIVRSIPRAPDGKQPPYRRSGRSCFLRQAAQPQAGYLPCSRARNSSPKRLDCGFPGPGYKLQQVECWSRIIAIYLFLSTLYFQNLNDKLYFLKNTQTRLLCVVYRL